MKTYNALPMMPDEETLSKRAYPFINEFLQVVIHL